MSGTNTKKEHVFKCRQMLEKAPKFTLVFLQSVKEGNVTRHK